LQLQNEANNDQGINFMKNVMNKLWIENKSLIVFITLMLVFRSAVADWNDVPTGSMKPTIVEGDRILINKLAYDINMPFTQQSLIKLADPKVNDIIIFESEAAEKRLVKRVIGLPGDIVSMSNNELTINHQKIPYTKKQINIDKVILDEKITQKSPKNHTQFRYPILPHLYKILRL
jgi:signal peptidase I